MKSASLIIATLSLAPITLAQDGAAPPPGTAGAVKPSAWRGEFTTWIWITGVEGDAGIAGLTADVSASFTDILEASDSVFAFSGRLEAGRDRWAGYVDGWYAKMGADDQSGPGGVADIDVTFEMAILDFGVMYRVGEWPKEGAAETDRGVTLDLYGGGRYTNIDLDLNSATLASRGRSEGWIDPIVGARLIYPLTPNWHLMAGGDVGGFGAGSDFTWSATGTVGYDFSLFKCPATLHLGYRAVGWDYSEGSGLDEFTWEVVQHGPIVGLALRF